MRQKIIDLKKLYDSGISKELFFRLILHCTDEHGQNKEKLRCLANSYTLAEWRTFYSRDFLNLEITKDQLEYFFIYMVNHYNNYFGNDGNLYFIHAVFKINNLRHEENFPFESTLMTAFEVLDL